VAQEHFGIYAAEIREEPALLAETATLSEALAWVQGNQKEVRRLYLPKLRRGGLCYGEIFDWEQGCTVLSWRIG
jgi:hypothetical protein